MWENFYLRLQKCFCQKLRVGLRPAGAHSKRDKIRNLRKGSFSISRLRLELLGHVMCTSKKNIGSFNVVFLQIFLVGLSPSSAPSKLRMKVG